MKRELIFSLILLPITFFWLNNNAFGQGGDLIDDTESNVLGQNVITTAVPFLLIAPDSRAGSLGDAGAATTPDVNSLHWNPAKYSFIDKDFGVAVSYTPWLRKLVPDINLAHLVGYKKINDKQVIAGSLLYFSLGDIQFTNINGEKTTSFNPNEFSIDVAYSRLLGKNISGSVALRYIYSNLTGGQYVGNSATSAGWSIAGDVAFYYNKDIKIYEKDAKMAFGLNISNIGSRISYSKNEDKDFIPCNFRFGGALTVNLDEYNSLMLCADINKLLVPTMPEYYNAGEIHQGDTVEFSGQVIKSGREPAETVPVAMIQSFYDAPGGFKEEWHELTYSVGLEYWYAKQFSIRAGYFYEHDTKGARKFMTVGIGLRLNVFGLDFGYLIPTGSKIGGTHPLANTLRFTLLFNFEGLRQETETPE